MSFEYPKSLSGLDCTTKCLICDTYFPKGSISNHLKNKHNKNKKYGETYVNIDNDGNAIPKNTRTEKSRKQENRDAKCLLCNKMTSLKAIGYHLKAHHNQKQIKGTNYDIIGEKSAAKSAPKKQRVSLTPQNMELRIPVTLVFNATFGNIKIE